MIDVATLVARACDVYGKEMVGEYEQGYLERIVKSSLTTKGRLLHYFPTLPVSRSDRNEISPNGEADEDDWCATHVDHGCLTGLTSAMYVDESAHSPKCGLQQSPSPLPELPAPPDPEAGLYIHDRQNRITHVKIPRDMLAFQTGEALERITQGRFRAVPHYVKGAKSTHGQVARNTLAVFTQPNLDEVVDNESGVDFAEFAREVVGRNRA